MANAAIGVDGIDAFAGWKFPVAAWKVHGDGFEFDRRFGARRQRPQPETEEGDRHDALAGHIRPPQVATTSTDSMTLRMNPAGFQFAVSGCVTPLVFVQRTMTACLPAVSVIG